MKLFTFLLFIASSFASAANSLSASVEPAPIKALIVTGQSNHNWRLSTPIVMRILKQTNLFEVDIAISPDEWL